MAYVCRSLSLTFSKLQVGMIFVELDELFKGLRNTIKQLEELGESSLHLKGSWTSARMCTG